jgi:hypothetical protein
MTPGFQNKSEELVYRICAKSFLSLWSHHNVPGKKDNELCDILVVFEEHVLLFSVKESKLGGSDEIDWQRWQKRAINESVDQLYGAERWLKNRDSVTTLNGRVINLPSLDRRKVYRIAVALGSGRMGSLIEYGDLGKGFVHVFDEISFSVALNELNTITDFVDYLAKNEASSSSFVIEGGEENLIAYFISQGRSFPKDADMFIVGSDMWDGLRQSEQYRLKQEADQESYVWDILIESVIDDHINERFEITFNNENQDQELALRTMARENRFSRRLLGKSLREFLQLNADKKVRSRKMNSPSGITYVFLGREPLDLKSRKAELLARCLIARRDHPENKTVIGIGMSGYIAEKGFSLELVYVSMPEFRDEEHNSLLELREIAGYFTSPEVRHYHEDEFPIPEKKS